MIPKDKIEMAKCADLPRVLQAMGIELVSNGKGYHLREHDSLKLFQQNGIWLYKWWSPDGEVGDGIQYLQRHYGMSFPGAVATLSGAVIFENSTVQHVSQQYCRFLSGSRSLKTRWSRLLPLTGWCITA